VNKKALSPVVTTVLIIIIAIAAVLILWSVLKPSIKDTAGALESGCINLDLEVTSCTAGDTGNVNIIRNAGQGEVASLKIVINEGASVAPCTAAPAELATAVCSADVNADDTVEVTAVLTTGDTCPVTSGQTTCVAATP